MSVRLLLSPFLHDIDLASITKIPRRKRKENSDVRIVSLKTAKIKPNKDPLV